jgi:dTDP-4-dehydrorhamnose 3,5-epimerase
MKVSPTALAGVLIVEPRVFPDPRGFFFESFNQRDFNAATGTGFTFVQDNHSRSKQNVLRGLHFQPVQPQGNWCGLCEGRCLMWWRTSGRTRPGLASG